METRVDSHTSRPAFPVGNDGVGPSSILAVSQDAALQRELRSVAARGHYELQALATIDDVSPWKRLAEYRTILLDRELPAAREDDALRRLRDHAPLSAVVVISERADFAGAVSAMRQGVSDCLLKPVRAEELLASLSRIERRRRLDQERNRAGRVAAITETISRFSHEARNELFALDMGLELLRSEANDHPQILEQVGPLRDCQVRLRSLVDDLRAFLRGPGAKSAPDAGSREPQTTAARSGESDG